MGKPKEYVKSMQLLYAICGQINTEAMINLTDIVALSISLRHPSASQPSLSILKSWLKLYVPLEFLLNNNISQMSLPYVAHQIKPIHKVVLR